MGEPLGLVVTEGVTVTEEVVEEETVADEETDAVAEEEAVRVAHTELVTVGLTDELGLTVVDAVVDGEVVGDTDGHSWSVTVTALCKGASANERKAWPVVCVAMVRNEPVPTSYRTTREALHAYTMKPPPPSQRPVAPVYASKDNKTLSVSIQVVSVGADFSKR